MRWKLKMDIIKKCGSQILASRELEIPEARLSRIVRGHDNPTPAEKRRLVSMFGPSALKKTVARRAEGDAR